MIFTHIRSVMLSVLAFMLVACGGGSSNTATNLVNNGPNSVDSTATLTAIVVTPVSDSIPKGLKKQFTATGIYSDGTSHDITHFVTWSSTPEIVVAIDSNGTAVGISEGMGTVVATQSGVSGDTEITVTNETLTAVVITPGNPTVPNGLTKQLKATGTYTDGKSYDITADVAWASDTPSVTTVDDTGLASTLTVGSSVISATLDSVSGSTILTSSSATLDTLSIAPDNPTIPKGQTQQFTVTGIYSDGTSQDVSASVWLASGDSSVATLNYVNGIGTVMYGTGAGSTAITATLGGVSVYTILTVTPATLQSISIQPSNLTVFPNSTRQLAVIGIYSDGSSNDLSSQATWTSTDTTVAIVSDTGLVSPVATSGSTDISVTVGDLSASTTVTIKQPELLSITFTASSSGTLAKGLSRQYTASGYYSDGSHRDITSTVIWTSSNTSAATIDSSGLVSSVDIGSTTIMATLGTISGSDYLYVGAASLQSITVTPDAPSVPLGAQQQLTAIGYYSDGSTQTLGDPNYTYVTWSSGDTGVATVTSDGLVKAVKIGSVVITGTISGISGKTTVTITDAALKWIDVTPADPMVDSGMTQQFAATGIYTDGSTQDMTSTVIWNSSDATVAGIDSAGLATVTGSGLASSDISATSGSISGAASLTRGTVLATPNAVAFQLEPGHSGQTTWNQTLSFPTASAWQVDLGGATRDVMIVNGRVFAITTTVNSAELLVALDETDGSVIWGPIDITSGYFPEWGGMAYDGGKLFVLNSTGLLRAYDAVSGLMKWSTTVYGQKHFQSPPVAANGRVFAKGAGPITAVDEHDGSTLWNGGTPNGTDAGPAVYGSNVFISPPCEVDAYEQATGAAAWNYTNGCIGAGGTTPVIGPNGDVFSLDPLIQNVILTASTGEFIGTFPGTTSPVVSMTDAYVLNTNKTLQSMAISNQLINWSFAGNGKLISPPLLIDNTVFIGASDGTVYALDAATGGQLWSGSAGSTITWNHALAAGGGYLIAPTGNGLTAWKIVP